MSPLPIPESFIEELVARSDIEDVVSDYVQLTKRSGANRFGLCPFHSEKTPSFAVNPAKQIFHCFGCGKGGGVINFIMEAENLSYPDAVAFLARRAGMEVPEDGSSKEERSRRARLLELNREAARFFYAQLSQPEGAAAIRYIQKRGIAPQMVKRFGLGAAPDSWSALTDALKRRGYSEVELVEAGLAKRGQKGGVYDTFRNRLMFPVIDVRGSVIGFSGRTLGDGEKEAKYLNSPDTPIFQKSRNLFALNLAKKSKMGILILAEGNIDVVSLHQAGFDCAVASLGTSLTEEQARLMAKYAKEVVIAYDADGAGQKAAQRAIGIFRNTGLNVRILRVEGAKDPDEFLKANGRDAFALLLEKSANDVDYRLEAIARGADLTTEDGRLSYLREATAFLATFPEGIEREVYAEKVARVAGIRAEAVTAEAERLRKQGIRRQQKREERQVMRPELTLQPAEKSLRYEDLRSARAEQGVIRLLLHDPELAKGLDLREEEFSAPHLGRIYTLIKSRCDGGETPSIGLLTSLLTPAEATELTRIAEEPLNSGNTEQALADCIHIIRSQRRRKIETDEDLLAFAQAKAAKPEIGG